MQIQAPQGLVTVDPETQHTYKTPRIGRITTEGQFVSLWEETLPMRPEPFPSSRTPEQWKQFHRELFDKWGGQWSAPAKETPTEETNTPSVQPDEKSSATSD